MMHSIREKREEHWGSENKYLGSVRTLADKNGGRKGQVGEGSGLSTLHSFK